MGSFVPMWFIWGCMFALQLASWGLMRKVIGLSFLQSSSVLLWEFKGWFA